MDTLQRLIYACGRYFFRIEKQLHFFVASGTFKLGKIDKKTGGYKGPSQEIRYFEGETPLAATQKLYYELKTHYEKEFNPKGAPEDGGGEGSGQLNQASGADQIQDNQD